MKIDSGTSFLDNGRQGRLIGGDESNQECRWTRLKVSPEKAVTVTGIIWSDTGVVQFTVWLKMPILSRRPEG
jgi:hypothetical protein